MRWTKENQDILWRTIFETQNFHIDLDKVADAWPGDEQPTPKALKEYLSKYRKCLGAANTVTFSMSTKRVSTASPRKKRNASAAVTKGNGKGKGKGVVKKEDESGSSDLDLDLDLEGEDFDEDDGEEEEERKPVVKRARTE